MFAAGVMLLMFPARFKVGDFVDIGGRLARSRKSDCSPLELANSET